MIPRPVLLVLIGILVVACQAAQPERTCDEVSASNLRDIIQQPGSPEQVHTQISDRYGLPKDQIGIVSYVDMTGFRWSKDSIDGDIARGDGKPAEGALHYNSRPPSIAKVIGCLGSPDLYWASYHVGGPEASWNSLDLYLFYLRHGVMATAYVHANGKEPPKLSLDLPMEDFVLAPVGSPEDTLAQLSKYESVEFRKRFKPWPGKLEDVIVEIDPGLTR